jgi:hypothetical protein
MSEKSTLYCPIDRDDNYFTLSLLTATRIQGDATKQDVPYCKLAIILAMQRSLVPIEAQI